MSFGRLTLLGILCLISLLTSAQSQSIDSRPELIVGTGHSESVTSVAYSPDGKTLASGSEDKTVKLWDARSGVELRTFLGHTETVTSVLFSPDGKMVASAGKDGTIRFWDVLNGKELFSIPLRMGISSIAFSPDGTKLAGGNDYDTIKVWDVRTRAEIYAFVAPSNDSKSIVFSPDGKLIAAGGTFGDVFIWDATTGGLTKKINSQANDAKIVFSPDGMLLAIGGGSLGDGVETWDVSSGKKVSTIVDDHPTHALSYSPDGKLLAFGSRDDVLIRNIETGDEQQLSGTSDEINSVTFSPDGSSLASSSRDGSIFIWDMSSGRLVRSFMNGDREIESVAYNPDGSSVVSVGYESPIMVSDTGTGRAVWSVAPQSQTYAAAYSPDGNSILVVDSDGVSLLNSKDGSRIWRTELPQLGGASSISINANGSLVAIGGSSGKVAIIDPQDGRTLRTFEAGKSDIYNISFGLSNDVIAAESNDGVQLWDAELGNFIKTIGAESDKIRGFAFDPTGTRLITVGTSIIIWDIEAATKTLTLGEPGLYARKVAYSPDGRLVATADEGITLWDAATGIKLKNFRGKDRVVDSIAFSASGTTLAAGTGNGRVEIWNVGIPRDVLKLARHSSPVLSVAISSDGQMFASGDYDGRITLWNLRTAGEIRQIRGQGRRVTDLAFSPDSKIIAGGESESLKLWNLTTLREESSYTGNSFFRNPVAFSPDGKYLVNGSASEPVKLIDVSSHSVVASLTGHTGDINTLAFSPDGKLIAGGDGHGTITLWDTNTGLRIRTINVRIDDVNSVAFSPNRASIAAGYKFDSIRIWDAASGAGTATLSGHMSNVESIAFSPDGKFLVSGGRDYTVRLWEVSTGRLIHTYVGHSNEVYSVAFSPNGKYVLSGGSDSTIKFWDVTTGSLLCTLSAIDEDDWLVVTPDGYFDGTPGAWKQLIWRFNNDTFEYVPVEAYFNDFFYPNLLNDVLAGNAPKPKAGQELNKIDRRQPKLDLVIKRLGSPRLAEASIVVTENNDVKAQASQPAGSGAQDLRLFRNGLLVNVWHGDLFNKESDCKKIASTVPNLRRVRCTSNVALAAGDNFFNTYVFNSRNVRSESVTYAMKGPFSVQNPGTLYVLAIGVNKYANPSFDLNFAVSDVSEVSAAVASQQSKLAADPKLQSYARTEIITLTNELATKDNILAALKRFRNADEQSVPANAAPEFKLQLEKIERAEPEDAILIYYAGHGVASGDRFYLLPHNFSQRTDEGLAHDGISDLELSTILERIDAGKMSMAIDACQSGQALGGANEGKAPMNSKGLAQLAYDKGMYILTAAQSQQAALEAVNIGGKEVRHGLMSYALLQAIAAPETDRDGNKQIWEREWLDYAVEQVPVLQLEAMKQRHIEILKNKRGVELRFVNGDEAEDPEKRGLQTPRIFYRREVETNPLIVAVQ